MILEYCLSKWNKCPKLQDFGCGEVEDKITKKKNGKQH